MCIQSGSVIIPKGSVDAGLYVIVSGIVEATLTGNIFVLLSTKEVPLKHLRKEQQRYCIDVILESDCFGEEFVLDTEEPAAIDYIASMPYILPILCLVYNYDCYSMYVFI